MRKGSKVQAREIDEYIAGFPPHVQTILRKVRATIRKAAPRAEETLSYRMPAFTLDGPLVYFAAFTNHIGFYPPVRNDPRLSAKTARYANEKGNLRFPLDEPIPYTLITQLVKARVRDNQARAASRKKRAVGPRQVKRQTVLLAGGNPQIAKADGDAPVQAYIDAIPGWKRETARRLDALVTRAVPGVHKAVRWNSPMYGVKDRGWFLSFHVFTRYVKVTFFKGTSLRPVPPGGTGKDSRWVDLHEGDFDETQLRQWIRQAAAIPGWSAGNKS